MKWRIWLLLAGALAPAGLVARAAAAGLAADGAAAAPVPPKFPSIAECVSPLKPERAVKTAVGWQFWFVGRDLADGQTLKLSVVAPHSATHPPHHHAEDEFFFVLSGQAEFYLNGETAVGGPNTSFYCPPNSEHGIRNIGDTELRYLVIKRYRPDNPNAAPTRS